MFASKYLYQQLMLSRTSEEQRKVFQSRIRHLENAFWHKKFIGKLND